MNRLLQCALMLSWALLFSLSCARQPPPQQDAGKLVQAGGGKTMHYVEHGGGSPVILIPGLFGTHRMWNRLIPYLEKQYRLIAIDNFGTGESGTPDNGFHYSVAEQADMVVALMDALEISRCDVIGVSYGGMIALNMAARYPDRVGKVVSIEGAVIMPRDQRYQRVEQGLSYPIIGDTIIGLIQSGLFDETMARDLMGPAWKELGAGSKSELLDIVSHNTRAASRLSWLGLARALNNSEDFAEEAKSITAPVLYLSGEKSSFREMTETNIAYFKDHLPNVRMVSFEDGVHDLELQKPRETAALIRTFIGDRSLQDSLSSR